MKSQTFQKFKLHNSIYFLFLLGFLKYLDKKIRKKSLNIKKVFQDHINVKYKKSIFFFQVMCEVLTYIYTLFSFWDFWVISVTVSLTLRFSICFLHFTHNFSLFYYFFEYSMFLRFCFFFQENDYYVQILLLRYWPSLTYLVLRGGRF